MWRWASIDPTVTVSIIETATIAASFVPPPPLGSSATPDITTRSAPSSYRVTEICYGSGRRGARGWQFYYSWGNGDVVDDRDGHRHHCSRRHRRRCKTSEENAGSPLNAAVPTEGIFTTPSATIFAFCGGPAGLPLFVHWKRCLRHSFLHPVCVVNSHRYLKLNAAPQSCISLSTNFHVKRNMLSKGEWYGTLIGGNKNLKLEYKVAFI